MASNDLGFRYPLDADEFDAAVDIENLANDVRAVVKPLVEYVPIHTGSGSAQAGIYGGVPDGPVSRWDAYFSNVAPDFNGQLAVKVPFVNGIMTAGGGAFSAGYGLIVSVASVSPYESALQIVYSIRGGGGTATPGAIVTANVNLMLWADGW